MPPISMATNHVRAILLAAFIGLCASSNVDGALLVNGYDADLHDRFSNSSSFIGDAYDWSGVGRRTTGGATDGKWATLISENYFVTATHNAPSIGNTFRFYEGNDATGSYAERNVLSRTAIAGSDLTLGSLSAPTFSGSTFDIKHYPILEQPALADYVGLEVFVVGQSADPATTLPANLRVGRNVIAGVEADFSDPALTGSGDVFVTDYDTTAAGVGVDEARVSGGDSGGPSFVVVDGQLAIAGVHWFVFSDPDALGAPGSSGSGDTLIGPYTSEIAIAMVGESFSTVSAVPEPSGGILIVVFGFVAIGRRSRRPV